MQKMSTKHLLQDLHLMLLLNQYLELKVVLVLDSKVPMITLKGMYRAILKIQWMALAHQNHNTNQLMFLHMSLHHRSSKLQFQVISMLTVDQV